MKLPLAEFFEKEIVNKFFPLTPHEKHEAEQKFRKQLRDNKVYVKN